MPSYQIPETVEGESQRDDGGGVQKHQDNGGIPQDDTAGDLPPIPIPSRTSFLLRLQKSIMEAFQPIL